jgi:hypothetical protein
MRHGDRRSERCSAQRRELRVHTGEPGTQLLQRRRAVDCVEHLRQRGGIDLANLDTLAGVRVHENGSPVHRVDLDGGIPCQHIRRAKLEHHLRRDEVVSRDHLRRRTAFPLLKFGEMVCSDRVPKDRVVG